jgi:hypothetical protein
LFGYFVANSTRNTQEQLNAKRAAVPTHVFAVEELTGADRDPQDINMLEGQRKGLGTALPKLTKVVPCPPQ